MDLDNEELEATRKLNGIDKNVGSIEEDIKILEKMLKTRKEQKEIIECAGGYCGNCNPDIKALENAIQTMKAYKELEEFKKQVTEIENTNFIKYKNYIPVSLVEEKIEELGNMTLLTVAQRQEVSYAIAVLQELLEKR